LSTKKQQQQHLTAFFELGTARKPRAWRGCLHSCRLAAGPWRARIMHARSFCSFAVAAQDSGGQRPSAECWTAHALCTAARDRSLVVAKERACMERQDIDISATVFVVFLTCSGRRGRKRYKLCGR